MKSEPDVLSMVRKHTRAGVLVDTNILLLHIVGMIDSGRVDTFKRTRSASFTRDDVPVLRSILNQFHRHFTTPHVLAEASNLLGSLGEKEAPLYRRAMLTLVDLLEEKWNRLDELAHHPAFLKLGLTDAAIAHVASEGVLVLTDDFRLAGVLQNRGLQVLNFHHVRDLAE